MSDFTNEAIQVARRLEEIAERFADGDVSWIQAEALNDERAKFEEKDRYLSAYFAVVNKNLELEQQAEKYRDDIASWQRVNRAEYEKIETLEQQLKTAKQDAVRIFANQQADLIANIDGVSTRDAAIHKGISMALLAQSQCYIKMLDEEYANNLEGK